MDYQPRLANEAVAEYLPVIDSYARRFKGVQEAEYDDLYQEGAMKVSRLLLEGKPVSNTAIKNAMRDWVRVCARRGISMELPDDEGFDAPDEA